RGVDARVKRRAELSRQLADSGALYLVTTPEFLDKANLAAQENNLREVFVFGDSFEALLETDERVPDVAIDPANDLAVLPYSSGTTGLPKGVMLTHRNLLANVLQCGIFGVTDADTVLAVLPFFHIYGMTVIMNMGLHAGATIVTMPRFDLKECLAAMVRYRITYGYVVPPIMLALTKSPIVADYDLSALRTLFSGAAPLSDHIAQSAAARLGCAIAQGYGMTEAAPATHGTRPGLSRGIGLTMQNTEAKIADLLSGADLGPGQEGEICVRGPQVMKGYLNNPRATAAMIDGDGWLHTGDIGSADEEGCFFIVDRVKELIKYKGMQIAPAELEAVLLAHPAIADAAVVPLADEEAGQVPKAYVVLKGQATAEDIMAYVAERVARFKRLRYVEIIDQIPRSPSGKILRRVLVERDRPGRQDQRPDQKID
ncbi:MAG: AMP-binding protein, partial [Acidobacteriota bacterium]